MKKINQTSLLDQKIEEITKRREIELVDLKVQYNVLLDSAKPINIIKQTFSSDDKTDSSDHEKASLKDNLLDLGISFLGGYFSKKVLFEHSDNNFKRILGTVLQYSVSTLIHKYNEVKK